MIEKDIIVIGAGLTGLTTAHHLNKKSADFCVLEQEPRVGGVIKTVKEKGFLYEKGPNSGMLNNIETVELFEDIRDLCEPEFANKKSKKRYILKNGEWHKLPSGLIEGAKTKLFTNKDKLRLIAEPFRKKGNNPDETLAELVKRRMGQSFLDYAVDPFVIGIYSGNPAYLVPKYAFPKLYNLEQNYGSFIGGAIKKSFQKQDEQSKKITREIFSFDNGLSSLTNALYESANPQNFNLNVKDITVEHKDGRYIISAVQNGKNIQYTCNKLVTTVGAYALKNIFPSITDMEIKKITDLKYAKVIETIIGFNKWEGMKLDGFGGLIPYKENRNILGYLFLSSFFKNRAPKDGALLTGFLGGVRNDSLCELDDNEIKKVIGEETKSLLKLKEFKPELFEIIYHKKAIPQYGVDSSERIRVVEKIQNSFPGLLIGGNLRDGVGVSDRIRQGTNLAKQAIRHYR